MTRRRTVPEHHPMIVVLAVWVGMLFWVGVYWAGSALAFVLDARLGTYAFAPTWVAPIAVCLTVVGAALVFWSTYVLTVSGGGSPLAFIAPPKRLVTWGIYSRLRHPMTLGFITLTYGFGLLLDSASFTFVIAPIFLVILATNAFLEESQLEQNHGAQYGHYRRWTPAFHPRLKRI